jgi:ABC-type antimicrobial peptide transport system permease subunit
MVSYRRREIGVRMALGATRGSVAQMILKQGSVLIGGGLVAGLLLALLTGQLIKGFLFGVKPLDGWTYGAVAVALAAIGLVSAYLPARRASLIEPMQALRDE